MDYHKPVLLEETLTFLAPHEGGIYVDATFGGGGHTRAILERAPGCKVIAFDWDVRAIEMNAPALEQEFPERFQCIWGNFSQVSLHLKKIGVTQVDGILADFGTSRFQIENSPGLSFSRNAPLDMRMSAAHHFTTAAMLVNQMSERDLADLFFEYGEERHARAIAQAIVTQRKKRLLATTQDLVDAVLSVVKNRHVGAHPATRVFQALRIVVNKELDNIKALLVQAPGLLKPHGRLVCISFHSLEDRFVKQFLREHPLELNILTKRVVVAQEIELQNNPSARSAKLRAAEKK